MKKVRFNDGWQFSNLLKSTQPVPVTLPHDAMQTENRIDGLKNGDAMGYYPGGQYRYEKTWTVRAPEAAQACVLEFEGIYQKSTVYLNGQRIGGHIYGYTDFLIELTGQLKAGENVLRVDVDNSQTPNSRWYTGSGIYRDVYLHTGRITDHIRPFGVKITTRSIDPAVLEVSIDAVTSEGTEIETQVWDGDKCVACAFGPEAALTIDSARLWTAETPSLYEVRVFLIKDGVILDETSERAGIRILSWNHEKGFMVNGNTVRLMGGCIHHDHGPLGACSYHNAERRRVKRLKEGGFNAIRYAHNPAGAAFLNACDELGMYVMDEAFDMWECRKSDRDYGLYFRSEWEGDLKAMVRVARNHPCVIMYSIGNEILDIGRPGGAQLNRQLTDCCHREDPSRPVMNALSPGLVCMAAKGIGVNSSEVSPDDPVDPYERNKSDKAAGSKLVNMLITIGPLITKLIGSPKKMDRLSSPSIENLDICGYNYGLGNYDTHRKNHPDCVLCGSETFNAGIVEHWGYVESHPDMIGEFVWTAWDYLGEAGIALPRYEGMSTEFSYPYPCRTAYCGAYNLIGHLEGQGAHVLAVWGKMKTPYIGVRPPQHFHQKVNYGHWRNTDAIDSWSWDGCEGLRTQVQVFASGDAVELFQDGKSLGCRKLTGAKACYEVIYHPGTLNANVYDAAGNLIGSGSLVSAVGAARLCLKAEQKTLRASDRDVAYCDITVEGDNASVLTMEERIVEVSVSGPATLEAVGSANPLSEELFTQGRVRTWQGMAIAVVRASGAPGEITVTAESDDLGKQQVIIRAI